MVRIIAELSVNTPTASSGDRYKYRFGYGGGGCDNRQQIIYRRPAPALGEKMSQKKSEKQPGKLEKFLDSIGLGSLVDAKPGDKESQKELVSKVENKKDVKDTNDGFEIFGYSVDDILDKIGDLLPQFESEQKKKNILEDIERIKSKMIK